MRMDHNPNSQAIKVFDNKIKRAVQEEEVELTDGEVDE